MNPAGEEYGRERLIAAVRECRNQSARDMIDFMHRDLIAWSEGQGVHDDVTFFVVKAL